MNSKYSLAPTHRIDLDLEMLANPISWREATTPFDHVDELGTICD
jgi:hypothetical protein